MKRISVVALGKIGLPLAVQFAAKGTEVIGCDINIQTVDLVNSGTVPFPGESFLEERLASVVNKGLLSASTSTTDAVGKSDVIVVVVPLFVDGKGVPDFGWMDAATRDIAAGLQRGALVSYETTLPVGTTRNRFAKLLEEKSGLMAGVDFNLVFSPERVLTGRVFADLRRYPKLVGGLTPACAKAGVKFYESVLDFDERPDLPKPNGVWNLGSCEASEMAKLAETTYRDVNIGLANQFAQYADAQGIDIYKVIEACNSQPYSHVHQPGIAVGGHCIPIYPQMYLWNDPAATIVNAARQANFGMPRYGVDLLAKVHGNLQGQTIGVFGASYRGGVKETAFSGVFDVVTELQNQGAVVKVHDPMYSDDELVEIGFSPLHYGEQLDAAVFQADHAEYSSLSAEMIGNARTILNGRNIKFTSEFANAISIGSGVNSVASKEKD
jgi:nucleotide sugar dehydrogenase